MSYGCPRCNRKMRGDSGRMCRWCVPAYEEEKRHREQKRREKERRDREAQRPAEVWVRYR
jgi:hypothetical protein